MAGKFNISQLLSSTSKQAEGHSVLKVIPININDLIASKDNFYSIDNIAELKSSVELFGVTQNLTVKPTVGGKYEIIAGHRRHRACIELVAEGKAGFEYVPCAIQSERDEIKERILLIMTNSTTRELSDWEKMKQAEELQKHFSLLKKRDNLSGRVRDLVAEALNTSSTQIARMNAISKNLTPQLKDEFQEGRLGLSAAYELSGLPEEKQKESFMDLQEKGGLSINDVKEKKQETAPTVAEFELKCYPETPTDFELETEEEPPENIDFADMSAESKADAAIDFLNRNKFALYNPNEDTRIFDFIIDVIDYFKISSLPK